MAALQNPQQELRGWLSGERRGTPADGLALTRSESGCLRQAWSRGGRYNRWWFYLICSLGTALSGPAIYFGRATILGYETLRVSSG
jgi:hypothetical protein